MTLNDKVHASRLHVLRRAAKLGLHPGDFLERKDSYSFFSALDDLLKPGPTGTNVNDLVVVFVF